ncbi:EF-hand domain-containing protein [Aeromonas rivuli]|uniref:calcium-binding EF-hand protein n=1 Tax=Aeromonas TaxID=642 RepID=UPI0005A92E6A|nr:MULTISPECIES: calcium-binding EF-hand protein [Aeromonas]MCS3456308.1 Ca2+-binding EF-hand superfamily protein [Aeromonas sp. BIGb0405]MCS3460435.1 Ca2+-binding EF-hand superfamily protein [Aeromonas sp. BIGb0445]
MMKRYFLPLMLLSSLAVAADAVPGEPLIKGDISKAQFMASAEKRFARQDQNGDGVISVAEKEATLAKMEAAMKQAGKAVPERMGNIKPRRETTKAQFVQRQEKLFAHLDKNGDGVISEAERADTRASLQKRAQQSAP